MKNSDFKPESKHNFVHTNDFVKIPEAKFHFSLKDGVKTLRREISFWGTTKKCENII